jgi:hypothetical protein
MQGFVGTFALEASEPAVMVDRPNGESGWPSRMSFTTGGLLLMILDINTGPKSSFVQFVSPPGQ